MNPSKRKTHAPVSLGNSFVESFKANLIKLAVTKFGKLLRVGLIAGVGATLGSEINLESPELAVQFADNILPLLLGILQISFELYLTKRRQGSTLPVQDLANEVLDKVHSTQRIKADKDLGPVSSSMLEGILRGVLKLKAEDLIEIRKALPVSKV
jgi:hypothetical protein